MRAGAGSGAGLQIGPGAKGTPISVLYQPRAATASRPFAGRSGSLVEVVQQGGNPAGVELVHDHMGALSCGLHV